MLRNKLLLSTLLAVGLSSLVSGAGLPVWVSPHTQTCTVGSPCTIPFNLVAGSGVGTTTFAVHSGAIPTGLTFGVTSITNIAGIATAAGSFVFRVSATDDHNQPVINLFTITVNASPIIIVPPVDPGAQSFVTAAVLPVGSTCNPYSLTLASTGGAPGYSYTITGGALPRPMTMTSGGVISGQAYHIGVYSFTVQSTDSFSSPHTVSRTFTLNIVNCGGVVPPLVFGAVSTSVTTCGSNTTTLSASGGVAPYSYALTSGSSLPAGLALSAGGVLTGTVATAGANSFSVTVTDSNTPASTLAAVVSYTVTSCPVIVPPAALVITTASPLPFATNCVHSPVQLAATGGTGSYSWSLTAGELPRPMTLSSGGLISGIAFHFGSYAFTIRVTDSLGVFTTKAFTWTISPCGSTNPVLNEREMEPVATFELGADGVPSFRLALPATSDIDGNLTIVPANSEGEFAFFANMKRVVSFNIPAGSTEAIFSGEQARLIMQSDGGVATIIPELFIKGRQVTPETGVVFTVRNNGEIDQ